MTDIHQHSIDKELFRLAFENANIGMCLVDLNGNIFKANSEMSAIFGYSVEELETFNVQDVSHPDYKHMSMKFMKEAKQGDESKVVFEKYYIHKNGNEVICEVTSSAVMDQNNAVSFFISHIRDITERRRNELNLKISKEKYQLLAENIDDVIWLFNMPQKVFTYVSPSVINLTGFTVEEAIQQTLKQNVRLESITDIMPKLSDFIDSFLTNQNKERSIYHEVQIVCKNGETIWIETVTSLQFNADQELELLAVSRNIEKRKQAELKLQEHTEELRQLNADKDRFMKILAHDLRNPFNALLGFTNLLLENIHEYSIDEIETQISIVNQTSHKTFNLLNDLLLWSQSQSGQLRVNLERLNFKEICNQTVEQNQNQANLKHINITCLVTNNIYLRVDKNMFKIIMRNLISNAIKFTPKNGWITIDIEKNQETAIIAIADNGVGISADDQLKLWDYTNLYVTEGTEKEQGSGLGLMLCKEFIDRHNETIWVESEPNRGSTFKFTMPITVGH